MKKILSGIILIVFLVSLTSYAGNNTGVSIKLEKGIEKIKNAAYMDTVHVDVWMRNTVELARQSKQHSIELEVYHQAGLYYTRCNLNEKALDIFRKAYDQSWRYREMQSVYFFRLLLLKYNQDKSLETKTDEVLSLVNKGNLPGSSEMHIYNFLGELFSDRKMSELAMDYYLKSLRLSKKLKSVREQAIIAHNIGLLEFDCNKYASAEKSLLQALDLAKSERDNDLQARILNNLGVLEVMRENTSKAAFYLQSALNYYKKKGFPLLLGKVYRNFCDINGIKGDLKRATLYLDSAMLNFAKSTSIPELQHIYTIKCNLALEKGDMLDLEENIFELDRLLNQNYSAAKMKILLKFKMHLYENKKDFQGAMLMYKKAMNIDDSLKNVLANNKIGEVKIRNEYENQLQAELYNKKIIGMNTEKQTLRWKWGLIVVLLVFILFFTLFYISYLKKLRIQQALFSRNLIENIDEERSRIAKNIHDDIGQLLSFIKVNVDMHNKGLKEAPLSIDREISEVIDHSRAICQQLYPASLVKNGIIQTIRELMSKTRKNIGVYCSEDIDFREENLNMEQQTHLYRIIQECVNNTVKHASANSIKLVIEQKGGIIFVSYKDNGKGFDSVRKSEGLGSKILKERVSCLGGELQVRTGLGGTSVDFNFSVHENRHN